MHPNEYNLEKAAYGVGELSLITGLSKGSIYNAVKAKNLKKSKFGAKTLFLATDVAAFLELIKGGAK